MLPLLALFLTYVFVHLLSLTRRRQPGPPLIYLEGNIAAGKSTLAASLRQLPQYRVVTEPVREWQNVEGHNMLALLYTNRPVWSFPFQALALATLGQRQSQVLAERPAVLAILERSPQCSVRVFAQYLADTGIVTPQHMAVLRLLLATVAPPTARPVHFLYVRTPPEHAFQRLSRRGRSEESQVTLEYLSALHVLTDAWLLREESAPVHVIDGTMSPEQVLAAAEDIIRTITAATHSRHPDTSP